MPTSQSAGERWNRLWQHLHGVLTANGASSNPINLPESPTGDAELVVRWHQALCLLPGYDASAPVMVDGTEALLVRLARQLRARLAPYDYAVQALHRDYGWPTCSPVHTSPDASGADTLALIGDALLAAPVLTQGAISRTVALPVGRWYDFWNDLPYDGGPLVPVCAPLERLPLFVRAGAALPLHAFVPGQPPLCLRVYVGDGESAVYEDGGEAEDYAKGNYRWVYVTCQTQAGQVSITRRVAGRYEPPYGSFALEVAGLPGMPADVQADRRSAPVWYYEEGRLELTVPDDVSEIEIALT